MCADPAAATLYGTFRGWNGLAGLQDLDDSWAGQDPWVGSWLPGWRVAMLLGMLLEREKTT